MNTKTLVASLIAIVLVAGAGWIVYQNRPVMQLEATNSAPTPTPTPTSLPTSTAVTTSSPASTSKPPVVVTTPPSEPSTPQGSTKPGVYSLADVQSHNTLGSCWSAVNGGVYDLTSWINRHPGGSRPIQGMCGTDGTAAYQGMHGGSKRPSAALVLLKIGTLE